MTDETVSPKLPDVLGAAARMLTREITEALRPLDLTPAQYAIIDVVDRDGPQYPTPLARRLNIETSTMAATLKRAERDGYIIRSPDPRDGRGIVIELTEKSRNLLAEARSVVNAVELRGLHGVDAQPIAVAEDVLRAMIRNFRE